MLFQKKNNFNLIELLLVLAIFVVIASLFFPSLKKTVNRSKQVTCMNQLRKVSHAFAFFTLDHDYRLPYASWSNNPERVFRGWDDFIQPYLGSEPMTKIEHDRLKIPVEKGMLELICPSSYVGPTQEITKGLNSNFAMPMGGWQRAHGKYIANAATGMHSLEPVHRPLGEVEDPGNTLLLGENDVAAPHHIQGLGSLISSPKRQVEEKSNGVTLRAEGNYALLLHPNSELGYLFVDGHVEADVFNSPNLIGEGTEERPKGAWTVDPSD